MIITTRHISDFIEQWAPNATKLDYDNTGLLVGNPDKRISKIITCLDVTPELIDEAIDTKADLIVAHHPLIFPKINSVTEKNPIGQMLRTLIRHDIDLIAAHTNLDAARQGVSFELASILGLTNVQFLDNSYKTLRLIVLRFPGKIRPEIQLLLDTLNLDVGWSVEENNIFVARFHFDKHRLVALKSEIEQVLSGSPFSIDILPSETPSHEFGFGAIGEFVQPMDAASFLNHTTQKLQARALRYSGDTSISVKTVAVCGGAGASLIQKAFQSGADAYITADIKYHQYFIQPGKLLIDAGHYETEAPIFGKMCKKLQSAFPKLSIVATTTNTNPMKGWTQKELSEKNH